MSTQLLLRIVPWRVRRIARALLEAPARRNFRAQLRRRQFSPPRDRIVLFLAGALPQDSDALIRGGQVKLLHLREAFCEDKRAFNILYLVSSAPPKHAGELVGWAKSNGAKFVWNQNGVGYPAWAGKDYPTINQPMRELLLQADHVVYQSAFCRASADQFLGRANCDCSIALNPVDTGRFFPVTAPHSLETVRLLTIGTHHYRDRVFSTINCLRELLDAGANAMLTIAGELLWPRAQAELNDFLAASSLSGQVKYIPAFTQKEAPEIYRAHHILLHPKYLDPCPTVVIEALSCGVPVVGSATGGMPELVDENSGVLIPLPQQWEQMLTPPAGDMADAVMRVIADWSSYSRNARERALRLFDKALWISGHREIFTQLLKQ